MAENVPSPTSTGGAGTTYEQRVGAVFLTYLLTGARPMIFTRSRVARVSFQTRLHGWKTDDLLVECSTDEAESHKMAVQVKFGTNIRPGSGGFAKTVCGFWEDFHEERFSPARDALVVAAVPGNPHLVPLGKLAECARNSSDAEDFARRLDARGSVSSKVKECKRTIHSIVGENGSPGVTDEELWLFLKAIHVCYFDLATSTNQSEGDAKRLLENSATGSYPAGDADATWNELVGLAADGASGAQAISRDSLPDAMLKRHETVRVSVLDELSDHSSVVLESINSAIAGTVTLPREEKMAEISDAIKKDRAVMLTGGSGYGKSALAKEAVRRHEESHTCLSFRAEEFAKSRIEEALPDSLSVRQFEALLGPHQVLIHIESLERLLEHPTRDAFSDLVTIAGRHPNVRLLLTCRDQAAQSAISAFFESGRVECGKVKVPPLDAEEMQSVKDKLPHLDVPLSQKGLDRLMRIPYYLDKAARMRLSDQNDIPLGIKAFRGKCWRDVIRKDSYTAMRLGDRREQVIVALSVSRARELRPFVPAKEYDQEALDGLHKDGIVIRDEKGLVAPAHDIIEDWAVMKWVEMLAAEHEWQARPMAGAIGTHPAVRRSFREWLREELDAGAAEADGLVRAACADPPHPRFLEDVLISVLLSSSVRDFVSRQKDRLLDCDAALLVELIRLTRLLLRVLRYDENDDTWGRVFNIIASVPSADGDSFQNLVEAAASDWYNLVFDKFRQILLGPSGLPACRDNPAAVAKLILSLRFPDRDIGFRERSAYLYSEYEFGLLTRCQDILSTLQRALRPVSVVAGTPSGGRGSTGAVLANHAGDWYGLSMEANPRNHGHLDLANHAGDWYGSREKDPVRRIEISIPGHGNVEQMGRRAPLAGIQGHVRCAPHRNVRPDGAGVLAAGHV